MRKRQRKKNKKKGIKSILKYIEDNWRALYISYCCPGGTQKGYSFDLYEGGK
jgi:hypothetical protein